MEVPPKWEWMVQKVKKADCWTVGSLLLPATTDFTKGRIELYKKTRPKIGLK